MAANSARSRAVVGSGRILVVSKKTYYTEILERKDSKALRLIAAGDESMRSVLPSHDDHHKTLDIVKTTLRHGGYHFKSVLRDRIKSELAKGDVSLIITVGGDGTVIDVSHFVRGIPVFAVNSAVISSHGHYCIADMTTFADVLERVASGRMKPINIQRLQLVLNGQPLPELVLNEALVSEQDKADPSRYILTINGVKETQRSDGLFFASAGGSSAWVRSYGSTVLPVTSRKFVYLVRGRIWYPGDPRPKLRKGVLSADAAVFVKSTMNTGELSVDGKHIKYDFSRGNELIVKPSEHDLTVYTTADVNSRYQHVVDEDEDRVGAYH